MANRDKVASAEVVAQAGRIDLWAAIIGVPPEALAAALYEEVSDEVNKSNLARLLGLYSEASAKNASHDEISINVDKVLTDQAAGNVPLGGDARLAYKNANVASRDMGVANLNIATSVRLLREYIAAHPNDDPLGLKAYESDYKKFVKDLSDPSNNLTVKVIGLSIKEAVEYFEENRELMPDGYWDSLSDQEKHALYLTFHNQGRANLEAKRDEQLAATGEYKPSPNGNDGFQSDPAYLHDVVKATEAYQNAIQDLEGGIFPTDDLEADRLQTPEIDINNAEEFEDSFDTRPTGVPADALRTVSAGQKYISINWSYWESEDKLVVVAKFIPLQGPVKETSLTSLDDQILSSIASAHVGDANLIAPGDIAAINARTYLSAVEQGIERDHILATFISDGFDESVQLEYVINQNNELEIRAVDGAGAMVGLIIFDAFGVKIKGLA